MQIFFVFFSRVFRGSFAGLSQFSFLSRVSLCRLSCYIYRLYSKIP